MLLIDDLQWSDQETLQWLHFLLRFDPNRRLLVIGTARPEEVVPPHPVADWLVQLRSEGRVIELALDALDAAETAQLAAQVTKDDLDDQSALRLYRETEGNPLFVVEIASAGLSRRVRKHRAGLLMSPRATFDRQPATSHACSHRRSIGATIAGKPRVDRTCGHRRSGLHH